MSAKSRVRDIVAYDVLDDNSKEPRLEIVIWKDHTHASQWSSISELKSHELLTVHSVGWRIYEDNEKVVLLANACKRGGSGFSAIHILKDCIVKRKTIKEPDL